MCSLVREVQPCKHPVFVHSKGMLKFSNGNSVGSQVSVSLDATSSLGLDVSVEFVIEKKED